MSFTKKIKALELTSYELERRILLREKESKRLTQEIKTLKALKNQALRKEAQQGLAQAAAQ